MNAGHYFRNQNARPWPESEPRQSGERCELSDLLVSQCACRIHKKESDGEGPHDAEPLDLDFG